MSVIILDTETTGTVAPGLVEAAWQRVQDVRAPVADGEPFCRRYDPGKPIEFGAMATHHITPEDLVGCPPASEFRLPAGVEFLVGHSIDFDWQVIGAPSVKRIDTLPLCRTLWPESDSHKQPAMLYLLDRDAARDLCRRAHSAAVDILINLALLRRIVAKLDFPESWNALWLHSERARVPDVMPFGKHKGQRIANVPPDYKQWLLKQSDVDPYLAKALRGETVA